MWTSVCMKGWRSEALWGPGGAAETNPSLRGRTEQALTSDVVVRVPLLDSVLNMWLAWWGQSTVKWQ